MTMTDEERARVIVKAIPGLNDEAKEAWVTSLVDAFWAVRADQREVDAGIAEADTIPVIDLAYGHYNRGRTDAAAAIRKGENNAE